MCPHSLMPMVRTTPAVKVDEFGLANIPGGCPSSGGTYDDGEDMLWVYSPSQTQPVKVTLQVPSGSGSGASLRIYRGDSGKLWGTHRQHLRRR